MDWTHFRELAPAWESSVGGWVTLGSGLLIPQPMQAMLGTTLFKGLTVYSPWFPRLANNATFLVQTVARSGATCTVTIQTKLASDSETGNITDKGNTIVCNATGVASARNTDLMELVRYKYVITGTYDTDWIHFLVLEPQWELN
jgi:hypothetical protein